MKIKLLCLLFLKMNSYIIFAQATIPLVYVGEMNDIVSEVSGLAVVYNTNNGQFEYWAHNDQNYPEEIYSVHLDETSVIQRTIDVGESYIDWEDLAIDDNNNIYLGDFGNIVGQNEMQILKIPDPNSYSGNPISTEIIEYEYQTNGVSDSEALIHFNSNLYIFTKSVNSNNDPLLNEDYTHCFKIPDSPMQGAGKHQAELHDSYQVIFPTEIPSHFQITAADISPDKKKLVLMSYERIWVFSCFENDDFFNGTVKSFNIQYLQYEGVSFINNHEIVISKEGSMANPGNNPDLIYIDLHPWIDSSCNDCEKVKNGNFDNSNLAWTKFTFGSGDAILNIVNGKAEIDINTIGTSQWHINLRHKSLVLEQGKTYRISYEAYAENDRLVSIIANKRDGSLGYYYNSQQITTIPTTYTHEFTMNETTDFNSYLSFNVGNYIAHKVYFDNVSLKEVDCICPQNRFFNAAINNTNQHFESSNNIYGNNVINGNDVKYDAANCVELNVGFEVKQGANFEAYNDGCGGQ